MFNIPFYISFSDYISFITSNFSSLALSDDIMFLTYIIINLSFLYFVIVLLKFIKGLCYFIRDWVFN